MVSILKFLLLFYLNENFNQSEKKRNLMSFETKQTNKILSCLCSIVESTFCHKKMYNDLWLKIIDQLSFKEIRSIRLVDKRLKHMVDNDISPIDSKSISPCTYFLVHIYKQSKYCPSKIDSRITPGLTVIGSSLSVNDNKTGFRLTIHAVYLPLIRSLYLVTLIVVYTTDEWITSHSVAINLNKIEDRDSFFLQEEFLYSTTFFEITLNNFVIESKDCFRRILYCIKLKYHEQNRECIDNNDGHNYQMVDGHLMFCPMCCKRSNSWHRFATVCCTCISNRFNESITTLERKNHGGRGVLNVCCTYGTAKCAHYSAIV